MYTKANPMEQIENVIENVTLKILNDLDLEHLPVSLDDLRQEIALAYLEAIDTNESNPEDKTKQAIDNWLNEKQAEIDRRSVRVNLNKAADQRRYNMDDLYAKKMVMIDLGKIIDTLSPNEAVVIRMTYGLGQDPKSVTEIAEEFNLTPEKIIFIRDQALQKMRHPARCGHFDGILAVFE